MVSTHGGGFMWILWLVITVAIVFLIIGLSKQARANRLGAKEILDRRFANGEIDEAEYNRRKALLEKTERTG